MGITYFNHRHNLAQSWGDRRSFVAGWWRIYAGDPYWVPPYFPALRRALEPAKNSHLARLNPMLVSTEALSRKTESSYSTGYPALLMETPVAVAVICCDPRRRDNSAYLSLLRCVNDADTLRHLLTYLAEALRPMRCRKIIGPTGLSPHLGSGLLQDYWNYLPPLHTPYNPPYMPEIANNVMQARSSARLYQLDTPPQLPAAPSGPATLRPLQPARLATDLLPLLSAACPAWLDFAPPDAQEAAFLLRWLEHWPLVGWLAQVNLEPVGFVLLQPNLADRLRRAGGGRNLLWRLWLARAVRRPTRQGRILFAGVLPKWRNQGIGGQLLYRAMLTARQRGWQNLSIGPLPATAAGAKFLERRGAHPRQTYLLYQKEL